MRTFYSALFSLLLPLIVLRLLWRSIKAPDYRKRWRERFAFYDKAMPKGVIWFHAVSVGEAEALFPLVKRLQTAYPKEKILISTTTPTGSARVRVILGDTVEHVYLPYDAPAIVKRFMAVFKPKLAVVMETEIWPNLFHYCGENKIPLYLINARLSQKSARGYRKIPGLIRPALAQILIIAAQSGEDAGRFIEIGAKAEQVAVTGNLKFDLVIPPDVIDAGRRLKNQQLQGRFVWMAASTHQGEEQIFLDCYVELKKTIPELLLVMAPRHPERFAGVEALCRQNHFKIITRSSKEPIRADTDVYLGDTMGELKMLYAAADAAFVGGSLVPVGGHNILEAIAAGTPVLFGPYMANFKEITDKVLQQDAARQCRNKREIVEALNGLYTNPDYRDALAARGLEVLENNRGALDKYYELLSQEIAAKQ